MWRRNSFSEDRESDQSISDEEEESDPAWPEHCVFLGSTSKTREGPGIASKLELLGGILDKYQESETRKLERNAGFFSEDELELPDFCDDGNFHCQNIDEVDSVRSQGEPSTYVLDVEQISDELQGYRRSAGRNEGEGLAHSGGRDKYKLRYPFDIQRDKKGTVSSFIVEEEDPHTFEGHLLTEEETITNRNIKPTSTNLLSGLQAKIKGSDHAMAMKGCQHFCSEHSVAELLDGLQDKNSNLSGNSKMCCQHEGKRIISDDDTCDSVHSESTEDEDDVENLAFGTVEAESKTMVDKFHEAFGVAAASNAADFFAVPQLSGGGLFARLQRVMQWEKEKDSDFFKKVQAEDIPKASCLEMKILSRSLNAKLTVCSCLLLESESSVWKESPLQGSLRKTWTIIFGSGVCGHVELDVGNLIRIHPPWKEVQVSRGGEIIILSTYFSQMFS